MTARTLTILFTDIVGSTAFFAELGLAEAERFRAAHFAALRRQIDRRDGREVKTLGDGVMAAFHGARDALESAVAMQQASLRWTSTEAQRPPAIRIGVSSGDVDLDDGDCFGLPVIEASRLCARAAGGEILFSQSTRLLAVDYAPVAEIGELELKGLPGPTRVWQAPWSPDTPPRVRAVIADDSLLVREGIAQVLHAAGIEIVGQASDGQHLRELTEQLRPDLAVVDIRMPPTQTVEGLEAAEWLRANHPTTGILVLTQEVEPRYLARLLRAGRTGVGYLLKERVADLDEFRASARVVATGGTVIDPTLLRARPAHHLGADR